MSYVDALEGKVLAIRKIEADARSILAISPSDSTRLIKHMNLERDVLEMSDCYYWSDEMIKIVHHASSSFPTNVPLSRTWLTSHIGWYWLGKNSNLIAYVTRSDNKGKFYEFEERICAFLYHWDNIKESVFIGAYSMDHMEPTRGPVLVFAGQWEEGKTYNEFIEYVKSKEVDMGGFDASLDGTLKIAWLKTGAKAALFFMTASLWMQQKIISIRKSPTIKNRMIRRSSIKNPQVLIIQLRRREYIDEEEKHKSNPIDWQFRWFVRGHWRNQYYKSEDVHKPIWIDPYIKGPEDKPLKEMTKTFAIVR